MIGGASQLEILWRIHPRVLNPPLTPDPLPKGEAHSQTETLPGVARR